MLINLKNIFSTLGNDLLYLEGKDAMTVFLLYNSYLFGTGCDCGWIIRILLLCLCSILQLKSSLCYH